MSTQVSSTPNLGSLVDPSVNRQMYLSGLLRPSGSTSAVSDASTALSGWQALHRHAADQVRSLSVPTMREEEWRFTDLSPLLKTQFKLADLTAPSIATDQLQPFALSEAEGRRLVFVDGVYSAVLSSLTAVPSGVRVGSLNDAELLNALSPQLENYLGQQSGADEVFTVLNTASFADVALIWVAKNQVVDGPVQILFVSTSEQPTVSYPRCLVVAESSSSLTLIEDYVAIGDGAYFTDPVTEIWLDENAEMTHCRIQRESRSAFHIGKTAIAQYRNSRYACHAISLGAQLSRHHLEVFQAGEQTETMLNGLTMVADGQLADTHSLIAYNHPHGTSRQLHKTIVDDRAHAVFSGKVDVPQAAQMTDAGQLNRNLLLSSKARVDTKPQLEIVADNVKCTHGATVSQLDASEVFYLQSRGIDAVSAQSLLIYAFAAEVIDQIPVESLKKTLRQFVSTDYQLPVG